VRRKSWFFLEVSTPSTQRTKFWQRSLSRVDRRTTTGNSRISRGDFFHSTTGVISHHEERPVGLVKWPLFSGQKRTAFDLKMRQTSPALVDNRAHEAVPPNPSQTLTVLPPSNFAKYAKAFSATVGNGPPTKVITVFSFSGTGFPSFKRDNPTPPNKLVQRQNFVPPPESADASARRIRTSNVRSRTAQTFPPPNLCVTSHNSS